MCDRLVLHELSMCCLLRSSPSTIIYVSCLPAIARVEILLCSLRCLNSGGFLAPDFHSYSLFPKMPALPILTHSNICQMKSTTFPQSHLYSTFSAVQVAIQPSELVSFHPHLYPTPSPGLSTKGPTFRRPSPQK
jgi:hypothetical protein